MNAKVPAFLCIIAGFAAPMDQDDTGYSSVPQPCGNTERASCRLHPFRLPIGAWPFAARSPRRIHAPGHAVARGLLYPWGPTTHGGVRCQTLAERVVYIQVPVALTLPLCVRFSQAARPDNTDAGWVMQLGGSDRL